MFGRMIDNFNVVTRLETSNHSHGTGCEPDESFLIELLPNTMTVKGTECALGKRQSARVFIVDNDQDMKDGEWKHVD